MLSTLKIVLIITGEVTITYCFYDARHGEFGLTDRGQCYLTVFSTTNRYWMGTLAPPGPPQAQKAFSRFVSAALHDNRMNRMKSCDAVFKATDTGIVSELCKKVPRMHSFSHILDEFILSHLSEVVYGSAITQNGYFHNARAGGAAFRASARGTVPNVPELPTLPNKVYFQHAYILGIGFYEFWEQRVQFFG